MTARIGLATCATLPRWERDDEPLLASLRASGVEFAQPVWDDPEVDWSSFDLVVVRTTWDYQSKHEAFAAWVDRVASETRLLNPASIVRWNIDKRYLAELEQVGVAIAPTTWLERGQPAVLAELVVEHGITRGFLKPVIAAGSRGTLRFDARDPAELEAAQRQLEHMTASEAMMLQPYLPAVEHEGELSAIVFDGRLSHAVRKIPVPGDYRVQDDHGASDEPVDLDPGALALIDATLRGLETIADARGWADALPLLYARIDMLRTPAGALTLNELELIEPSLFFRHAPDGANRLTAAILARL